MFKIMAIKRSHDLSKLHTQFIDHCDTDTLVSRPAHTNVRDPHIAGGPLADIYRAVYLDSVTGDRW